MQNALLQKLRIDQNFFGALMNTGREFFLFFCILPYLFFSFR